MLKQNFLCRDVVYPIRESMKLGQEYLLARVTGGFGP
jgi:hypothetical protein